MPQQEDVHQRCMARALYDNVAEAPDELAFRKGDLLTVLEQNTSGIEGWWLCVLRGRQGICPGNRLKIVVGLYANESNESVNDLNTLQKQGKRRSWNIEPHKVLTPQKVGDVFLYDVGVNPLQKYDVPSTSHNPSQNWGASSVESSYDVPPHPIPVQLDYANIITSSNQLAENYDVPQNRSSIDNYDIPRPIDIRSGRLSPSSSISSLTTNSDSISSSSTSNRSSSFIPEYDVPRSSKVLMSQSFPSQLSSHDIKELPLELQHAQDNLLRLETDVVFSINKLINFASPDWRHVDKLQPKLNDIKIATYKLQSSLHDFTLFTQRCLGNALKAEDKSLYAKLNTLVNCLLDSDRIIYEACRSLNDQNWDINRLARNSGEKCQPDSLDQLIVICIKSVLDHVKHISSFIQGNSPLLFKRSHSDTTTISSLSDNSRKETKNIEWCQDDYVNSDKSANIAEEDKSNFIPSQEGNYEMLSNRDDAPNMDSLNMKDTMTTLQQTSYSDKQILLFYAAQMAAFSVKLTHAIDLFLQTVEHNQPPKVFLSHGKFVLLNAYRLVYIGDAVQKNLSNKSEMKNKVMQFCNVLCESLGITVLKTRKAALQFPSVTAVQEMVDSVVDISHVARDLKISIVMCTQQL